MAHWLFKTEPDTFSIDDLAKQPRKTTLWDGVRNYQARNFLRNGTSVGDEVLVYHSSCETPGIAGIARIVRAGYPDPTAVERRHAHYDPDSDPAQPRWYAVDVQLVRKFKRVITLEELKRHASRQLRDMIVLRTGNRLSVMPVDARHWQFILTLE